MQIWDDDVLGRLQPIRLGKNRRDDVRDVKPARNQEDNFDLPIRSSKHQDPDQDGRDGNRDVSADVKHFHGCRHARKFRNDVGQVNEETRDHYKKRGAEAEFLANKIG